LVQVGVAAAAGGEARGLGLERLADLHDRRQLSVALEQLLGERRHDVLGRAQEVDAVAVADLDQPADAQRRERLAHGGAAHAQALGELALGHQAIAGPELLDVDELAQPLGDLDGDVVSSDPLRWPGYTAQRARARARSGEPSAAGSAPRSPRSSPPWPARASPSPRWSSVRAVPVGRSPWRPPPTCGSRPTPTSR